MSSVVDVVARVTLFRCQNEKCLIEMTEECSFSGQIEEIARVWDPCLGFKFRENTTFFPQEKRGSYEFRFLSNGGVEIFPLETSTLEINHDCNVVNVPAPEEELP